MAEAKSEEELLQNRQSSSQENSLLSRARSFGKHSHLDNDLILGYEMPSSSSQTTTSHPFQFSTEVFGLAKLSIPSPPVPIYGFLWTSIFNFPICNLRPILNENLFVLATGWRQVRIPLSLRGKCKQQNHVVADHFRSDFFKELLLVKYYIIMAKKVSTSQLKDYNLW